MEEPFSIINLEICQCSTED